MAAFIFTEHHENHSLGRLIHCHGLYEHTHTVSRFKSISTDLIAGNTISIMGDPSCLKISHFSTVVCKVDDRPIGLLIFENYSVDSSVKTSFIVNKKKRCHTMLGFIGTYVVPEFRNQGIARQMMDVFNHHIESKFKTNERHVYMLCAMGKSFDIAESACERFLTVSSPYNLKFWKQKARNFFIYNAISLAENALMT